MPNQSVNIPPGANVATVQVLDAQGNDITDTCTITVTPADPTLLAVGAGDGADPENFPFETLQDSGSTQLLYNAQNTAGSITETDTLTITVTAPATINVTYQNVMVMPTAAKKPTPPKK
jgi:hypothetical protein